MSHEKEQLIARIDQILSTKHFTEQAKKNLRNTIILMYNRYIQPSYIKRTRTEMIEEYLHVLETMNGYAIIKLDELNLDNEASRVFREDIKASKNKTGNLELIDGKYVPTPNGSYYCSCLGFTWKHEGMIFSLEQLDPLSECTTVLHEMTHLEEGRLSFLLNSSIPMSFEIRKMLYEGRAATRETMLHLDSVTYQIDEVSDKNSTLEITANTSYPTYSNLYQMLQILFGDEILEELAKNNDSTMDSFQMLKSRFPQLPVDKIFAHIIYILNCYHQKRPDVLISAIHHWTSQKLCELSFIASQISYIEDDIQSIKKVTERRQTEMIQLKQLLENPEKLANALAQEKEEAIKEVEKSYQSQELSEEEYRKERSEIEEYGTLENYRQIQEKYLKSLSDNQTRSSKKIQELKSQLKELYDSKNKIEEDQFCFWLEQICLKNPSLETSFAFLIMITIKQAYLEFETSNEKKGTKLSIANEIMQILSKLQDCITNKVQKNTSLVS